MSDTDYSTGSPRPKPEMRVTNWVAINSGALVGKCTVELSLMRIVGVMVMRGKDGELWAALPSAPTFDREGKIRTTVDGKKLYERLIEWRSKEIADKFSAKVVALLRADSRINLGDSQPEAQAEAVSY